MILFAFKQRRRIDNVMEKLESPQMEPNWTWRERDAALEAGRDNILALVDGLQAQIDEMRQLAAAMTDEMAALVPIQSLPDEIVFLIFRHAYEHHFPHCRLHSGQLKDSPVVITHVCRRWRRLALDLSHIWSCIHITMDQPPQYQHALAAFLDRSRQQPLSIMFLSHSDAFVREHAIETVRHEVYQRIYAAHLHACWDLLLLQHDRWKHCGVYCSQDDSMRYILQHLRDRTFPALEYLIFFLEHDSEPENLGHTLDITAPVLKSFRISGGPTITMTPLSLYTHLTELVLDGNCLLSDFPYTQLMATLAETAATLEVLVLIDLDVYIDYALEIGAGGETTYAPIPWRCLRSLYIQTLWEMWAEAPQSLRGQQTILRRLLMRASQLETLYLFNHVGLPKHLEEGSLVLPALRALWCIDAMDFYSASGLVASLDIWRHFVKSFPSIEAFHIADQHTLSELADVLQEADIAGSVVWPGLRTLTFRVTDLKDLGHISPFFAYRTSTGHPLENYTIGLHMPSSSMRNARNRNRHTVGELQPFPLLHSNMLACWDGEVERPRFLPWNDSLLFYDQFNL